MPVGSRGTRRTFRDELCRRPADGSRAPDDVETQETVVTHADPKGPALQPRPHCILQGLQVIPFLRFRCVLGCVETSTVTPVVWVERQDLSCYWERCGRFSFVRQKQDLDTCWGQEDKYWKQDLETPLEANMTRTHLENNKKRSQRSQKQLSATRELWMARTSSEICYAG